MMIINLKGKYLHGGMNDCRSVEDEPRGRLEDACVPMFRKAQAPRVPSLRVLFDLDAVMTVT